MEERIPARLTPAENRRFALTVGVAFLVVGALLWYRGRVPGAWAASLIGATLILAGLILPAHLGPVHRGWMSLAKAISRVTTPVFLGVVYFLLLTPVGVVLRLLGRDPLASKGKDSAWQARGPGASRSDLTRQF